MKICETSRCGLICRPSLTALNLIKPFIYIPSGLAWRDTRGDSSWGCAARFSKSWHYFRPKICHFTDLFSDQTSKIHTCFQVPDLAFRQKLCHHYLDSVCKQKNSSNAFRIRIFLLLSYSFGIETINMLIHSHSTLENHTLFQTKMGKVCTRFQTKTRPGGAAHTY